MPVRVIISTANGNPSPAPFLRFAMISFKRLPHEPLRLILRIQWPMHRIHRAHHGMQRFLSLPPVIRHIEAAHQRRGLLHIQQIAMTLHVGLPGQYPQVAH